jgi:hypothetical protein
MTIRTDCHAEDVWTKPGASILICVDGGRCRERRPKRGKRKKGQKRQGYHSEWFEPKILSISQFDENGKKLKNIAPIIDGSCGTIDDFFDLLKQHLLQINLDEASNIIFCADNGPGIWTRTEKLIKDLDLQTAKCIISNVFVRLFFWGFMRGGSVTKPRSSSLSRRSLVAHSLSLPLGCFHAHASHSIREI